MHESDKERPEVVLERVAELLRQPVDFMRVDAGELIAEHARNMGNLTGVNGSRSSKTRRILDMRSRFLSCRRRNGGGEDTLDDLSSGKPAPPGGSHETCVGRQARIDVYFENPRLV